MDYMYYYYIFLKSIRVFVSKRNQSEMGAITEVFLFSLATRVASFAWKRKGSRRNPKQKNDEKEIDIE